MITRATQILLTPIAHVACYEPAVKVCDGEGKKIQQFWGLKAAADELKHVSHHPLRIFNSQTIDDVNRKHKKSNSLLGHMDEKWQYTYLNYRFVGCTDYVYLNIWSGKAFLKKLGLIKFFTSAGCFSAWCELASVNEYWATWLFFQDHNL